MSEHLFRFLLSELDKVRVRCAKCRVVVEVPVGKLREVGNCPACQTTFRDAKGASLFLGLDQAISDVLARASTAEIEFVLPQKG